MPDLNKILGKLSEQSSPFGDAAQAAMEKSQVLQGCVALKPRTLPATGPDAQNLLTLNQLKDIAVTIAVGIRRPPGPQDTERYALEEAQMEIVERLVEFFDAFLPVCLPNYSVLNRREDLGRNVQADRAVSYACHPQVIQLMANVWARWRLDRDRDPGEITGMIGSIYLRAADPENTLEKEWKTLAKGPKKGFQNSRHESWEKTTALLLQQAEAQQAE